MGILRVELDIAEASQRASSVTATGRASAGGSPGPVAYPSSYVRGSPCSSWSRCGSATAVPPEPLLHQVEELARRELDGPDGRGRLARTGCPALPRSGGNSPPPSTGRAEPTTRSGGRSARPGSISLPERQHDAVEAAAPRRAALRPAPGRARAAAGPRGLGCGPDAAAKSVAIAVDLAAEKGMLQTVAADGAAVLELIELAAWRVPGAWMDRLRRALPPDLGRGHRARSGLVEGLTDRERDVLHLLPSRLTLREIASELFISQNTLKFHLRVIYRKLGVNSRAEAVECARRLRSGPGPRCGRAPRDLSCWRSNSSAESTPRSTRCSESPQLVDPPHGSGRRGRPHPPDPARAGAAAGRRGFGGTRPRASRPAPLAPARQCGTAGPARAGAAGSARRR